MLRASGAQTSANHPDRTSGSSSRTWDFWVAWDSYGNSRQGTAKLEKTERPVESKCSIPWAAESDLSVRGWSIILSGRQCSTIRRANVIQKFVVAIALSPLAWASVCWRGRKTTVPWQWFTIGRPSRLAQDRRSLDAHAHFHCKRSHARTCSCPSPRRRRRSCGTRRNQAQSAPGHGRLAARLCCRRRSRSS